MEVLLRERQALSASTSSLSTVPRLTDDNSSQLGSDVVPTVGEGFSGAEHVWDNRFFNEAIGDTDPLKIQHGNEDEFYAEEDS